MQKMIRLTLLSLVILFGASACANTALTPKYNPKLGWIKETNANGEDYWIVSDIHCSPDQPIGTIGSSTLGGQIQANVLPDGTKLYSIKGVDQTKTVAVELDYGQQGYVEAVNVGSTEPR